MSVKYTYSFDNKYFNGVFDYKEEAIEQALKIKPDAEKIYIGMGRVCEKSTTKYIDVVVVATIDLVKWRKQNDI